MKLIVTIVIALTGLIVSKVSLSEEAGYRQQFELPIKTCTIIERQYESSAPEIFNTIESGAKSLNDYAFSLDRNFPITIKMQSKRCGSEARTNGLPNPDFGQPGDTRTVTQTRGNIRTTYEQIYVDGAGWVTTKITREILPESPEPPPGM